MHKESNIATAEETSTKESITEVTITEETSENNITKTESDEFEQYLELNKADGIDHHIGDSYNDYPDSYDDYGPGWYTPEFHL